MQSGMSSFLVLGGLWLTLSAAAVRADDWPQWRGPGRDGVWKETGVVETFDKPQLDLVWRQPIGGGYCGPTVAQGRLYVADRLTTPTEQERILCFDAMTGERLWAYAYEREYRNLQYASGPRASISIDDGRAYALGSFADFHCLDAASGKVLWGKDMLKEYQVRVPQWGIAAAPLVEGDLVVLHVGGSNGACLVAFDKKTGEERWRALNDRASYSAPIIIDQAGKRVLVCLTGERVVGLDLQSGQLDWECPFPPSPRRGPITVASPVFHSGYLFFTNFYEGSLLLKVVPDKLAVEEAGARCTSSRTATRFGCSPSAAS
ncbi:MAG: PQQ-like beta-propeller repeat protein [Candidatus Sumerlaeota bacterium]|nr:PQQ-like beta-propeller repeat protein [Candidatus Sumerlaeota bacterium]